MEVQTDFLSLPAHVLRGQVLQFLTEWDIFHLDDACCSRVSRAELHGVLRGAEIDNTEAVMTLCGEVAQWMRKRKCYFTDLALTSATELEHIDGCTDHCIHVLFDWGASVETKVKFLRATPSLVTAVINGHELLPFLLEDSALFFPWLKYLDICEQDIDDRALAALVTQCPHLDVLILQYSNKLTCQAVRTIAENCTSLQDLTLTGDGSVTDADIGVLAGGCPHLRRLEIGACGLLTDPSVDVLLRGCPNLTALTLTTANAFTDAALRAVAAHRPGILRLDLGIAVNLTDAGVIHLAERCTGLQSLTLHDGVQLSDAASVTVARHCSDLREIHLDGCLWFTDLTLLALARHCAALESVMVRRCTLMSDAAVVALVCKCPELRCLYLNGMMNEATFVVIKEVGPNIDELIIG